MTSTDFIGRESELYRLEKFADTGGAIARVRGIAGSGKSWLLEQFVTHLDPTLHPVAVMDLRYSDAREPVDLLLDVAHQLESEVDFEPFFQTVHHFDQQVQSSYRVNPTININAPVSLNVSRNRFGGQTGDIAAVISNVQLSVSSDELQRIRDTRRAEAVNAFWSSLLKSPPALQPIVLLDSFEHVESAPGISSPLGSWLWGELLDPADARRRQRLRFVLAGQKIPGENRRSRYVASNMVSIDLDRFTEEELEEYFATACGTKLPPEALEQGRRLSKGNPLCAALVAELFNNTDWDYGLASRELGDRMAATLVAGFLTERILQNVDAELADALRLATVPRRCDEQTIRALLPSEADASALWKRLTNFHFLNPARDRGWQFHEVVREVVQQDFERGDDTGFRAAQGRMAERLARQLSGEDWTKNPLFPEYVFHLVRAEPTAKRQVASQYSRGALRARNVYLATAIADATEGACGPEMDSWTSYSRAVAQLLAGQVSLAQGSLIQLWEKENAEKTLRLLSASAIATSHQRSGELSTAADWAKRSLKLVSGFTEGEISESDSSLVAGCLNDLGTIFRAQIKLREARDTYDQVIRLTKDSDAHDSTWEAGYADLYRGVIYTAGLNDHRIAGQAYAQAQTAFHRLGDIAGTAIVLQRRGWLARIQGKLDEALDLHQEAEALLSGAEEPLLIGELLHSKANVLRQQGNYEAAAAAYEAAGRAFAKAAATRHLGILDKDLGEMYLALGRLNCDESMLQLALEVLKRSLDSKKASGQVRETSVISCLIGEVATDLGDFELAAAALDQALAVANETDVPINRARALAKIATLSARARRTYDPTFGDQAANSAGDGGFWHYVGEAFVAKARHEALNSHLERAATLLVSGLRSAQRYNNQRVTDLIQQYLGGPLAANVSDDLSSVLSTASTFLPGKDPLAPILAQSKLGSK